jgi:hypothetical protein
MTNSFLNGLISKGTTPADPNLPRIPATEEDCLAIMIEKPPVDFIQHWMAERHRIKYPAAELDRWHTWQAKHHKYAKPAYC